MPSRHEDPAARGPVVQGAMPGAAPGWAAWPTMPGLIDPDLQSRLVATFAKLGVAVPEDNAPLPSLADALLGRLAQTPTFAHLWDLDQKFAGVAGAWTRLHLSNLAYRALVARAWTTAQQRLLARSAKAQAAPPPKGSPDVDWRANLDAGLSELNGALLELMRSDEYLKAQRQLMSAGMDMRDQLRHVGEDMAELFQLPGRTEVDDLTRSVADMRRELRRVSRAHDAAPAPAPAPAPAAPAKPVRRTRSPR
jgi:HAMP domain-containing protein